MTIYKKQMAFIDEYMLDFNATQAAKRAGYSERSAHAQGCRLLKDVEIAAEIRRRMKERTMEADEVLMHLTDIARGSHRTDIVAVREETGDLFINAEMYTKYGHIIKSIRDTKDGFHVTFEDRLQALVQIGKHYKLFTDKIEIGDWVADIIALVRDGKVTKAQVEEELGTELVEELFAGVNLSGIESGEAQARG